MIEKNTLTETEINKLKDTIQSANVNFLIGSGLSRPFLSTLGKIEKHITELDDKEGINEGVKKFVLASLFNLYFKDVMYNNICVIEECKSADRIKTSSNYTQFLMILNTLLQRRGSSILNRQINLFTTNIDLFFEKTLEVLGLEFNDGFSGRLTPTFSIGNYHKILFKRSSQFDNESRIPIFNLLKIHGSLNWEFQNDKIAYRQNFDLLKKLKEISNKCDFLLIDDVDTLDSLIKKAETIDITDGFNDVEINKFLELYKQIPVVNPTKAKFKETILDLNYYELLRFYSNELEKENTILFVLGFSMADEHIAEMTIRLAKSNPTLTIIVFAYDESAKNDIIRNLKNIYLKNIIIYYPDTSCKNCYDFEFLNNAIFQPILDKTEKNE